MKERLFLIDGHALVFKMYYAFLRRPMINSKGADMSILFGFTKYILELISREQPDYIAVAFDPPGGTFRNQMYPEYKATRAETPQLVIDSLEPLIGICKALGITTLMVPGFEADDVIGSMAKREAKQGKEVYMVTPDKDYGQLVDEVILYVLVESIVHLRVVYAGVFDKAGVVDRGGAVNDRVVVVDHQAGVSHSFPPQGKFHPYYTVFPLSPQSFLIAI